VAATGNLKGGGNSCLLWWRVNILVLKRRVVEGRMGLGCYFVKGGEEGSNIKIRRKNLKAVNLVSKGGTLWLEGSLAGSAFAVHKILVKSQGRISSAGLKYTEK